MKKILLFLITISIFTNSNAQDSKAFFELNVDSDIDITATSNGSYRTIDVTISNFSKSSKVIDFPLGGFFVNLDTTEQNLVVLFYEDIEVKANSNAQIKIGTACANPKRKAPLKNRTTWVYDYDNKIAGLLYFYHTNRPMVELFTGSEHHSTIEKRHNFLQMCVWVYYNADRKKIIDFATKYMFEGDREAATEYVDLFYPLVVTFIDLYKKS